MSEYSSFLFSNSLQELLLRSTQTSSGARQFQYSHFLDPKHGDAKRCTVAFVILGNNLIVHGKNIQYVWTRIAELFYCHVYVSYKTAACIVFLRHLHQPNFMLRGYVMQTLSNLIILRFHLCCANFCSCCFYFWKSI